MGFDKGGFAIVELSGEKASLDLADYRDEGCELFPACLDCPLPRCLEESQGGKKQFLKQRRDSEIRAYHDRGSGTALIARMTGVSQRTVQRIIGKKSNE